MSAAVHDSEDVRWWSCRRKRRFQRRKQAERTAQHVREMYETIMTPYHCQFCNGYHLATAKARRQPRRREESA